MNNETNFEVPINIKYINMLSYLLLIGTSISCAICRYHIISFINNCINKMSLNFCNCFNKKSLKKKIITTIDKECSICLEKFKKNEECYILKCSHCYHKNCIETWLIRSKNCPMCRLEI